MNDTDNTFVIPTENLPRLQARLAKLSKKSEKLLGIPITLTVVDTFDKPTNKEGCFKRYHKVSVNGPKPIIAGWKFVAALDVVEADGERLVVVRAAPGEQVHESLRDNPSTDCGHCHTVRNRKTMYVLRKMSANT